MATTLPRIRWCLLFSPNLQCSMRRRMHIKLAKMGTSKLICRRLKTTPTQSSRLLSAHSSFEWRMLGISWTLIPVSHMIRQSMRMEHTFNITTISPNRSKSFEWINWLTRRRLIASLTVRCLQLRMIQALPKMRLELISLMERWEICKLSSSTPSLFSLDGTVSTTHL